MKVGYIRVSTIHQNTERQLDGIALEKKFIDCASGKSMERPKLQECLSFVREGDTLIVHSMDRLARNLIDLRKIVEELNAKGVAVQFIKENVTFNGQDDSPMSKLLLSMLGAFAEFERAIIRERQKEGIELARQRKAFTGRPRQLNNVQIEQIKQQIQIGSSKEEIIKRYGISRATLYRYISETKKPA